MNPPAAVKKKKIPHRKIRDPGINIGKKFLSEVIGDRMNKQKVL